MVIGTQWGNTVEIVELTNGNMLRIHDKRDCKGQVCPVHRPTDHAWRSWGYGWDGTHMLRVNSEGERVLDPDDYLFRQNRYAILRNSAKCTRCNVVLVSNDRHDFKSCPCGNVFVDGGRDYLRHGVEDHKFYENTSEVVYWREQSDD